MGLIRILVPSWRFFDRIGRIPELLYRVKRDGVYSPWMETLERPERKFHHLFINAEGNLYLAYQGLIDRMLDDSQIDKIEIEDHVSFRLIKNHIHKKVLNLENATHYEFKVSVSYFDKVPHTVEKVFVTPEYEV